jgi:DNA-binding CsgD family transcriptional regulator
MTAEDAPATHDSPPAAVGRWDVDILCMVARGFTTREAAAALHLSEHAVRRRVAALRQLTASDNRQELISLAFAVGLIVPTWPPIPARLPPERVAQLLTAVSDLRPDPHVQVWAVRPAGIVALDPEGV